METLIAIGITVGVLILSAVIAQIMDDRDVKKAHQTFWHPSDY